MLHSGHCKPEKEPRYALKKSVGGPRRRFVCFGGDNCLDTTGIRTLDCPASSVFAFLTVLCYPVYSATNKLMQQIAQ